MRLGGRARTWGWSVCVTLALVALVAVLSPPRASRVHDDRPAGAAAVNLGPAEPPHSIQATEQSRHALSEDKRSLSGGPLSYADESGFAQNLQRLNDFLNGKGKRLAPHPWFDLFVSRLLEETHGQGDMLLTQLANRDAHPFYRAALVTCLAHTNVPERDDVIWQAALDTSEDRNVRIRALLMLERIDPAVPRRDAIRTLLDSANDPVFRCFALRVAPKHMDETVYDDVKALIRDDPDVNVRIAAVQAVAVASFPDRADVLRAVASTPGTSRAAMFSPDSLVKRAAVYCLDPTSSRDRALLLALAHDEAEELGVRAKALRRCADDPSKDIEDLSQELLMTSGQEDLVLLRAAAVAVVKLQGEAGRKAVRARIKTLSDPQAKRIVLIAIGEEEAS